MQPLWIINLTKNTDSNRRLRSLVEALCRAQGKKCWHYSELDVACPIVRPEDYRPCIDRIVDEGRMVYNSLQQQQLVVTNMQVCILGDVSEAATQNLFQTLPFFLKHVFPDIIGRATGRGLLVTGFLYIPHNLNHESLETRTKSAVFIEELNQYMQANSPMYYARVVAYQNIQKSDVRYYPELGTEERTDLLFQYLLNIFYLEDDENGVFLAVDQRGFYSLGAASIYYDAEEHRQIIQENLLGKILDELKNPENVSKDDTDHILKTYLDDQQIGSSAIIDRLEAGDNALDLPGNQLNEQPESDPVKDFLRPRLFASYYLDYLRFLPARAIEFARAFSYMLMGRFMDRMKNNKKKLLKELKGEVMRFPHILRTEDVQYKTITQLKDFYLSLKHRLEKQKERIIKISREEEREVFPVPDYLKVYYTDLKFRKKNPVNVEEIAQQMRNALRSEPTVLSLLVRCILLGTVLIFVIIPLLRWLSPYIINLGDVANYEWAWIIGVFTIPFIYYMGVRLRRHFLLVRKLKHILLVQALLDVQQKASGQIYKESLNVYDELMTCCDTQIECCDKLVSQLLFPSGGAADKNTFQTIFNQPFVGGDFRGEKFVDTTKLLDSVQVGPRERMLPDLKKEDYIRILKAMTEEHASLLLPLHLFAGRNDEKQRVSVDDYIEAIRLAITPLLHLHDDENLGEYINKLGQQNRDTVNLLPLFRMADLNGMLTDSSCTKEWHIRVGRSFVLPEDYKADFSQYPDSACKNMIFVSSRCLIRYFAPSCGNVNVEITSDIPFTVKICCFFSQYLHEKSVFTFNDKKIDISYCEMAGLECTLKELKLWNS